MLILLSLLSAGAQGAELLDERGGHQALHLRLGWLKISLYYMKLVKH